MKAIGPHRPLYRLGILGDAHGNLDALSLCIGFLRDRGVEGVVFLGDAVGYLPYGPEVCDMLMHAEIPCLMGNHEAMLLGRLPLSPDKDAVYGLSGLRSRISKAWLHGMACQGPMMRIELAGKLLLCCHGTPADPLLGYGFDPELIREQADADCIITGHTHRPHLARLEETLLLNPGSCGLPRDRGDLLSLAILELPSMRAEIFRLPVSFPMSLRQSVHPSVQQCFDRRGPFVGRLMPAKP